MLTLLLLWFSEALKFFNHGIPITTAMMTLIRNLTFTAQTQVIFVLLRKKTKIKVGYLDLGFANLQCQKIIYIEFRASILVFASKGIFW